MWVTAYTDGSVRPGKSSWAIWLRSKLGRIVKGGECPPTITDANVAELFAVKVAIIEATREWHKPDKPIIGIQVNSDNAVVVQSLWAWSPIHRNIQIRDLQEEIRGLLAAMQIRISLKHVKAHTGKSDIRSYLNQQCDKIAKKNSKQQSNWRCNGNFFGGTSNGNAGSGLRGNLPKPLPDWEQRRAAGPVRDGTSGGTGCDPAVAFDDAPKEHHD